MRCIAELARWDTGIDPPVVGLRNDGVVVRVAVTVAFPGHVLPLAAGSVGVLVLLAWAVSVAIRDASIVDVVWGPALALVALVGALSGDGDRGRRWLLFALTLAWGGRLAVHIARRKFAERGEDRRYARMRARHPYDFGRWSLWAIFVLQGVLVLVVSLPVQVVAQRPSNLTAAIGPGLVLFAVGLAFEAIGDEQLRRFKSEPGAAGRVMDRGLWRYTRHPNYFGDACVWWGLWLVAVPAGGTWWTAVGPAVMTGLLVRVSGKRLLERDIAVRRPGYTEYVRRTSGFVPLPPRDGGDHRTRGASR